MVDALDRREGEKGEDALSDLSDFTKAEKALHEKLLRDENPTLEEWFAYLNHIGDAAQKAATTDDSDLAAELVESIASWAWAPEDVHKYGKGETA